MDTTLEALYWHDVMSWFCGANNNTNPNEVSFDDWLQRLVKS